MNLSALEEGRDTCHMGEQKREEEAEGVTKEDPRESGSGWIDVTGPSLSCRHL